MTALTTYHHRHAELVSASIPPTVPAGLVEKWTLKQVQRDEQEFVGEARKPLAISHTGSVR